MDQKKETGFSYKCRVPLAFMIIFLLFFFYGNRNTQANVRPAILEPDHGPTVLFNFDGKDLRNFSAKQDCPSAPAFPVPPVDHSNSRDNNDRCIIKESFRIYADRGQNPLFLFCYSIFIGYPSNSKPSVNWLSCVLPSSQTGKSYRIRPPPPLV